MRLISTRHCAMAEITAKIYSDNSSEFYVEFNRGKEKLKDWDYIADNKAEAYEHINIVLKGLKDYD